MVSVTSVLDSSPELDYLTDRSRGSHCAIFVTNLPEVSLKQRVHCEEKCRVSLTKWLYVHKSQLYPQEQSMPDSSDHAADSGKHQCCWYHKKF